jgi:hypothetical protein
MATKEIINLLEKYVAPFRITKGEGFRLKDIDPSDTCGLRLEKGEAVELVLSQILCGVRQHRFNFFFCRSRFSDMFSAKLVLMLLSCGQRPALSTGGACKFGEGCEDTAGLGSALRRNRERWRGVPQMRDLTPDTPKMVASLSDAWPSRARRTKQGSAATCFAQSLCAHRGSHP